MTKYFLIMLCCLSAGCSTTRLQSEFSDVSGALPAAVPISGLPFSFLHQQVSGSFQASDPSENPIEAEEKKVRQLQVVIENSGTELVFVALSSSGLQLYKVRYNGSSLEATAAAFIPAGFEPWRIVSDFMAMYADGAALRQALAPHGWTVETTGNGRTIRNSGGLTVLTIECAASCFRSGTVRNNRLNYQLNIKTLAYENAEKPNQQSADQAQRQHALDRRCRIARRSLHRACQH